MIAADAVVIVGAGGHGRELHWALSAALDASPLNRIGEPDDIAGAALLLGSDAGRFITGTTIVVDGGATIRGEG